MTDYTPTTEEVREKYAFQVLTTSDSETREGNRRAFDRWLYSVIETAAVNSAEEALRELRRRGMLKEGF